MMRMNGVKSEKFWTTSLEVEAIRLTEENIQQVSANIGGGFYSPPDMTPWMVYKGDEVHLGEWVIKYPDGRYSIFADDAFRKVFHSHGERLAKDEKYAAVYLRIKAAMNKQDVATYHDKGSSDEMDLVAIETTKELLKLL